MPGEEPTASLQPEDPSGSSHGSAESTGRFQPGEQIGERYRVVSLLGRGGMGEVYRADDLTLGQSVALKLLPPGVSSDPVRLERLKAEVRLARQVSHPSVCRVYDIGEDDGRHFLAMEYIDGEDLADLLRRIGRVPGERAVEIARQLCAGLAAAHDAGIIHRDLKPSNIMIDGRGRARITDFGVAALADDTVGAAGYAGTPAYMAPEQLERRGATRQSDVYALGLVLYELFTGQRAHPESKARSQTGTSPTEAPTTPSSIVAEIDEAVEAVILRCLEPDPGDRPKGVLAVMAALPGGDPLQSMLDAGETPSPELVAASGKAGAITKLTALVLLLIGASGALWWYSLRATDPIRTLADRALPAPVLEFRAREVLSDLGYQNPPAQIASMFGARSFPGDAGLSHELRVARFADDTAGRFTFRYREHSSHFRPVRSTLPAGRFGELVTASDPPVTEPGMLSAELTPQGRLLWLKAVLDAQSVADGVGAEPPDWAAVLEAAGFEEFTLEPVEPITRPPVAWDERRAWEAAYTQADWQRIRIEAASLGALVTHFSVSHADDPIATLPVGDASPRGNSPNLQVTLMTILIGIPLAVRNLRQGRGDRRGAARLFVVFFILGMSAWVMSTSHTSDFETEVMLFISGASYAFTRATLACLVFIALEPLIRRAFPRALIGWSRMLAGRWRDPRVGRDVLIGCAAAGVFLMLGVITGASDPSLNREMFELASNPRLLLTTQILAPMVSTTVGLTFMLLFVGFKLVFTRPTWLAPALMLAAALALTLASSRSQIPLVADLALTLTGASIVVLLLYRIGLLAVVLSLGLMDLTPSSLVSLDPSRWYSAPSIVFFGVFAALLVYGFVVSSANEPFVRRAETP